MVPTERVRCFAPGSIGNVGPGLDVLGLATAGAGDTVVAERAGGSGITIADPGHPDLPADPTRHSSALAAAAVLRRANEAGAGIVLRVSKGLPLSAGQGGSAASAAAGAGAVNALLGWPLSPVQLIEAALEAETMVAGRHADNLAPSVLGGLVLVRSMDPLDVVRLPVPADLTIVLVHPDTVMRTREARAVLPASVPLDVVLHQCAQVAAIVAAAASGDRALLGRALDDRLAEPARAPLLPGFIEAKAAALAAGALGCSISGSGPTAFALAPDLATAPRIVDAMIAAYAAAGLASTARITHPDLEGLQVSLS
jgi:homoserine kinase